MNSIRKWIFKPKKSDSSLLARFYYADEELNTVAAELDSFDGRKEPERCTSLINKLRSCQDKLLCIVEKIMQEAIPEQRASRDFRVKFPDDVMQDNLAGQLWFGAECLAAGSSIMNREVESASMRPLARTLTRHLDHMRGLLREQSLKATEYTQQIKTGLVLFDKLFSEFELSYVSAMVPVKTMREYDMLQQVMVLFSETVQRAVTKKLITADMIDSYDPALMFTIPRLAIVCGLNVYPEGPLNPDMDPTNLSEMFRPFQTLLYKIRELLSTLTDAELLRLERALCSTDEPIISDDSAGVSPEVKHKESSAGKKRPGVDQSDSDTEYSSADALSTCSSSSAANDESIGSDVSGSPMSGDGNQSAPLCRNNNNKLCATSRDGTKSKYFSSGRNRMPHQESKDSGMPSDPDVTSHMTETAEYFAKQEVASYRLRHSKSWPNAKRRKSQTKHSSGSDMAELGASGGGASIELIDTSDDDVTSEDDYSTAALNSRARSSHEFTFSIPADTSLRDPTTRDSNAVDTSLPSEPRAELHHSTPAELRANFPPLSGDFPQSDDSSTDGPGQTDHVSFVTEALSAVFLTDPVEADEFTCSCDVSRKESTDETVQYSENTTRTSDIIDVSDDEVRDGSKINTFECDTHESLRNTVNASATQPDMRNATVILSDESNFCDNCKCSIQSDQSASGSTSGAHSKVLCSHGPEMVGTYAQAGSLRANQEPAKTHVTVESNSSKPNDVENRAVQGTVEKKPVSPGRRYFRSHSCPCKPLAQRPAVYKGTTADGKRASTAKGQGSSKLAGGKELTHGNGTKTSPRGHYSDSETSSSLSDGGPECENDEITLAIAAAENAARQEARARFRTSSELIHKLFVCISGVADQLQTNYAADLRHILKCVFECNSSEGAADQVETCSDKSSLDTFVNISAPESPAGSVHADDRESERREDSQNIPESAERIEEPPCWVPDEEASECWSCKVPFTFVRRRHHCRNCGKVFCGRCSSNNVPLPQYGHHKPVRVCNRCFMFHVTPFTVDAQQ